MQTNYFAVVDTSGNIIAANFTSKKRAEEWICGEEGLTVRSHSREIKPTAKDMPETYLCW